MHNDANKLTPELVSYAIQSGMLDIGLDALDEGIRRRKELLAKEKAHKLLPGHQFLAKDISPKKLNGVEFRFLGWDDSWLRCEFVNLFEKPDRYSSRIKLRESHVGTITKAV